MENELEIVNTAKREHAAIIINLLADAMDAIRAAPDLWFPSPPTEYRDLLMNLEYQKGVLATAFDLNLNPVMPPVTAEDPA